MKRESFTQYVKDEICLNDYTYDSLKSLLSGFIRTNGEFDFDTQEISLQTENSKIAKLIYQGLVKIFDANPKFFNSRKMKLDKCVVYKIKTNTNFYKILEDLEIYKDGVYLTPKATIKGEEGNRVRNFLTGVFLASGSVNSPSGGNYHLQMVVEKESDAKFVVKLLNKFRNDRNVDAKIIQRRKKYMVYVKKADQISNFLALVGASNSMLEFENIRIEKDFINSDNRYQICFNANYKKTLEKANAQLHDIQVIEQHVGLYTLKEKERAVASIRKENVDIPLSQIVEILKSDYQIKLSKSSVNRIFNDIHDLASRLESK